ncbi:hypothetical protein CHARACLAT_023763 [Characodon lateralis]|uniref:Uncharacterized protein n=1 Tax=Characodon lateralis TaxID=208331 RepID=A0ABU7D9E0_9TELE|nr:hypothetical protein [Characodon lateralis]
MSQKRTHPSGAEERGRREKSQDKAFTSKSPSHRGLSPGPPVDPAEWPAFLSESDRTEQVIRGPLPIRENCFFPQKV